MTSRPLLVWTLACSLTLLVGRARADPLPWPPAATPTLPMGDQVVTLPPLQLSPDLAARELFLQRTFNALREGARGRTWLLGGMIGISATLVGFGAAYPRAVGAFLLPVGILGVARGVAGLTLLPDPRDAANTFLRMPQYSADSVRARLRFGEQALAAQARVDRRTRIADGTVAMLISASYVPLTIWIQARNDASYRFRDDSYGYALLVLSVINAATSLVTALTPTPSEERYEQYQQLVHAQEQAAPAALDKLSLSLSGTREGLQVAASLRL
jgi:hypothetical protein